MTNGLDLEFSFNEALKSFGVPSEIAHIIWLPFPMLIVLVDPVAGRQRGAWAVVRQELLDL